MSLADVALVAGTVLAATSLIPQIAKLVRTRDPAGVSSTWPAIGVVTNAAWTAYLIHQGLWPATISAILVMTFFGVVMWALHRTGVPLAASVWRGVAFGVGVIVVALTLGWFALGTVLGVSQFLQVSPAIITAYRSALPTGIAPGTWWIAGAEGILWGYYGQYHADIPIVIFAATYLLTAALMLARYWTVVGRQHEVVG